MSNTIAVGAEAPDFTLQTGDGEEVTLSSLRGQKVVLAFYPLDWSGTCTKQMAGFAEGFPEFESQGAKVFGISVDSSYSHHAWSEALGARFPLLADFNPKGAVAQQYGVYNEERGYARRVTFVIDEQGVVRDVIASPSGEFPSVGMVCDALRRAG
jgi:peroxiredoxin